MSIRSGNWIMKWRRRFWGSYAWCLKEPRGITVAWIPSYDEASKFLRTQSAIGQL